MGNLLLAAYYLFWAICDLFHFPIMRGTAKFAAPDKERSYRSWRGILFLLFVAVLIYVFLSERIYLVQAGFGEALLRYGLPFMIPLCGIFLLNYIYRIPPLWDRSNH